MMGSESESEGSEWNISHSEDDNSDVSSDVIYSESSESEDDGMSSVRMWVEEKMVCPAPPRFRFTENPGILVDFSDDNLIQYFEYFFDDSMLQLIVDQTNIYAEQCLNSQKSKNHSKQQKWHSTYKEEVRILFCIWIMQGIVKKPVENHYWSNDEKLRTPFFRKMMSYRRYQKLKKYLHFCNNEDYNPDSHPHPKLNKIWPIYSKINELSQNAIILDQDVSLDESLLLYKGRLAWKQYLPMKRARFGIKTYMLCEAKSGYIWSSIIYTGKGTPFDEEFLKPEFSKSMQVVLTLMRPLLHKGYCVTLDNYYSSPILTDKLVECNTDTYGTINLNRKEVPNDVKSRKLKKGDTVAFRRGKALILKWKDKKNVTLISTIHNSEMSAVQSSTGEKLKPKIVIDYNDTMGGVDRADQNLACYAIPRNYGRKYYKKIFFHLFDQCIWNSYVLYKKNGGSRTQLQFRLDLVNEMVIKYHSESMSNKKGQPSFETPLRLTERHFVKFIPPTVKKEKPARKCVICCRKRDHTGKRIRKETRYYCELCDVGLCAVSCFEIFHKQHDVC